MIHLRDGNGRGNHQHSAERQIPPERDVEDQIRIFVILPLQRDRQGSGHRGIKPKRDKGHVGSHHRSEWNETIYGWTQMPDQERHVENPHNHAQAEVPDVGSQVEREASGPGSDNWLDCAC